MGIYWWIHVSIKINHIFDLWLNSILDHRSELYNRSPPCWNPMRVPTSIPCRAGGAQSVIERVASNSLLETYFGVPTHPTVTHTFCLTWKQCSQQFAGDVVRRAFTHIRDLKAVFSTSWGRRISACVHTHSYTSLIHVDIFRRCGSASCYSIIHTYYVFIF